MDKGKIKKKLAKAVKNKHIKKVKSLENKQPSCVSSHLVFFMVNENSKDFSL